MNSDPISPPLHIPAAALVLDVGSGHRPHPRADVLCEKWPDDDTERGSSAVIDRPLVLGDAQALPFRGGAFGYVIARHVVEHLDDPTAFFAEAQRVAAAGYVEAPSLILEYMHPGRRYHKWLLLVRDGVLHLAPKPREWCDAVAGTALEQLGFNSLEYGLLLRAYKDLFYVRYAWQGALRFQVYDALERAPDFMRAPWDAATARPYIPARGGARQLAGLERNLAGSIVQRLLRPYVQRQERREVQARLRRRPVDLEAILMCPQCRGEVVQLRDGTARCPGCGWQTRVLAGAPPRGA